MNLDIELASGRRIWLEAMYVTHTYSGLLMGRPDARSNRWVLDGLAGLANRIWPGRPLAVLGLDDYVGAIDDPLPSIQCLGSFASAQPARDPDRMASSLIVCWFQDDITTIMSARNVERLRQLDWPTLAGDFDW